MSLPNNLTPRDKKKETRKWEVEVEGRKGGDVDSVGQTKGVLIVNTWKILQASAYRAMTKKPGFGDPEACDHQVSSRGVSG